jgi:hypothetical protein
MEEQVVEQLVAQLVEQFMQVRLIGVLVLRVCLIVAFGVFGADGRAGGGAVYAHGAVLHVSKPLLVHRRVEQCVPGRYLLESQHVRANMPTAYPLHFTSGSSESATAPHSQLSQHQQPEVSAH